MHAVSFDHLISAGEERGSGVLCLEPPSDVIEGLIVCGSVSVCQTRTIFGREHLSAEDGARSESQDR
jgi:hypothetical protein